MRALLPLAALLLAIAPPALAQVTADASLAVEGLADQSTNQTAAQLPFTVRVDLSNFFCVGQGATLTVALTSAATGNATATVLPSTMTFVVPANAGVTGYSHAQSGVVVVGRPGGNATSPTNATVIINAQMTEVQGCQVATVGAFGASGEADVAFEPLAVAQAEPGPAMPAPGLALGALVLGAAAVALRRRRA